MNKMTNIETTTVLDVELQFALENEVWFNATKMVKNFNDKHGTKKRLDKFWELSETQEYIAVLSEELGSPKIGEPIISGFKQVINSFDDKNGTYVHPELGILLARYLSPKFAIACDRFIKNKMKEQNTSSVAIPQTLPEALRAYATEVEKNQTLAIENKSQAETIEKQKKELNEVKVHYNRRGEMINAIMMSDNLYKATQLGTRFGISAVLFNRIMNDAKVIRKVNGVWTLRSKYTTASEPYAVLREERKSHAPNSETVMSFAWTAKGVKWVEDNWNTALERMSDATRKTYDKAVSKEEPKIPKKRAK